MITSRTTTTAFFILLLGMNIISLAWLHIPLVFYIILVVLYISISVLFSFFISSGFYLKAYCKKATRKKILALTFDDGPDPSVTPAILDVLQGKACATFFCIGRKIDGNEEILKRMAREGHLIGTHSYSHSDWFDLFPAKRMRNEFILTDRKILDVTGKKPL